jgi:hypothetical protein
MDSQAARQISLRALPEPASSFRFGDWQFFALIDEMKLLDS